MSFSTKHHGDSVSGALGKWCCWNKPGLGDRGASLVVRLVKNLPAMRETWVHPWVGKIPFRRERLPTPVFWPGDFHGLYISWGCKVGHDCTTFTEERDSHLPPPAPGIRRSANKNRSNSVFSEKLSRSEVVCEFSFQDFFNSEFTRAGSGTTSLLLVMLILKT